MIWFAWRQFRTQTWITVGALVALGVLLVIGSRSVADAYSAANVAACQGDCTLAITNFLNQVRRGVGGTVHELATAMTYVVPALIGIFWGAPLIARELETGTHRLAWNQSVTRTRWLATKLAIVGSAAAATAGLLSWAVTSWAQRIDQAADDRITPLIYGARGIVPIGYALFAFSVGVTLGMLIRRTVPAMAATLGVYILAVTSMAQWIREHLIPARHVTTPLDTANLNEIFANGEGQVMINNEGRMSVIGHDTPPGTWELSNRTITPTGQVFTGPADPQHCGPDTGPGPSSCLEWVGSLGLRQDLTYQPANHFWPLQWAETGIFIGVAVLLTSFCFWWTRRRLT